MFTVDDNFFRSIIYCLLFNESTMGAPQSNCSQDEKNLFIEVSRQDTGQNRSHVSTTGNWKVKTWQSLNVRYNRKWII